MEDKKPFSERVYRVIKYSLLLIVGSLLVIPLIFFIMYLQKKGKKIVFYPDFKIIPNDKITDSEIKEKRDAVEEGKKLLKK